MNKALAIILAVMALSSVAFGKMVPVGNELSIHHVPKHYGGQGYSYRYNQKLVPATPLGYGYGGYGGDGGYGGYGLGYGGYGLGYGGVGLGYGGVGLGYGGSGMRGGFGYGGFGYGGLGYGAGGYGGLY